MERQAEPRFNDGTDAELHFEMLRGNPEADAVFQNDLMEDARRRGVDEATVQSLYGEQPQV